METFETTESEKVEFSERLRKMEQVAQEAGEFMLGAQEHTASETKLNAKDHVTVADVKSQDLIRGRLRELYPEAVILSEEDDEETRRPMLEPNFTGYIIDPIDGTYNFKRDMRESAISIGYVENGELVSGVVFDPYKNEMFVAEKGSGAYRNGERIHVSDQQTFIGASVGYSNSYDDEAMFRNSERHLALARQLKHMPWTHCHGSGVLIMTNIACGRFDAYHHNGLKPWDNAAAFLIIREAGGVVQNLQGDEAHFTDNTVLCGTPTVVAEIRAAFDQIVQRDPALLT